MFHYTPISQGLLSKAKQQFLIYFFFTPALLHPAGWVATSFLTGNTIEVKTLTLDGVTVPVRFYSRHFKKKQNDAAKPGSQRILISFFPAGAKQEQLRHQLAQEITKTSDAFITVIPHRDYSKSKMLGGSYLLAKREGSKRSGPYTRKMLHGDNRYDIIAAGDLLKSISDDDSSSSHIAVLTDDILKMIDEQPEQYARLLQSYDKIVLLSPNKKFLHSGGCTRVLKDKQLLFMGSKYENIKLRQFTRKYGGSYFVYEKASSGYGIFFRSFQSREDLYSWLNI